jgi:hypothetical protein
MADAIVRLGCRQYINWRKQDQKCLFKAENIEACYHFLQKQNKERENEKKS